MKEQSSSEQGIHSSLQGPSLHLRWGRVWDQEDAGACVGSMGPGCRAGYELGGSGWREGRAACATAERVCQADGVTVQAEQAKHGGRDAGLYMSSGLRALAHKMQN